MPLRCSDLASFATAVSVRHVSNTFSLLAKLCQPRVIINIGAL